MSLSYSRHLIITVFALLLCACGASKNVVVQVPVNSTKYATISVVKGDSTVTVEDDDTLYFREKLMEYLGENFTPGEQQPLILTYRFIGFERGNRFKRYLSGGIGNWGEGGLVIQTTFNDIDGNELAVVNTDAEIGSGFFGGDIQSAFKKAAKKIAEFTALNFAQ